MQSPSTHIAIVKEEYLRALLDGRKSVESRLSKTRRAPWGCVRVGDTVYFRAGGMSPVARARVRAVWSFEGLTPGRVGEIRKAFGDRVCADEAYWQSKIHAKYGVLMEVDEVCEVSESPPHARLYGNAWVVLPRDGLARRRVA